MELFYRTFEFELINDAKFESSAEAKADEFKYIETYYNTKRMHSAIGYVSPAEYESGYQNNLFLCLQI